MVSHIPISVFHSTFLFWWCQKKQIGPTGSSWQVAKVLAEVKEVDKTSTADLWISWADWRNLRCHWVIETYSNHQSKGWKKIWDWWFSISLVRSVYQNHPVRSRYIPLVGWFSAKKIISYNQPFGLVRITAQKQACARGRYRKCGDCKRETR